jgi:sulfotransferase family protein
VRRFVASFHEDYARSAGKSRWADKSPDYVWHLDWLLELFPTAKFVLLTRFALDQVDSHVTSQHALAQRLGPRPDDEDVRIAATRYWVRAVDEQLRFAAAHSESCHLVRYEDLCRTPEPVLRTLFSFLDEPWDPRVLDFAAHDHDFGYSDARARTSREIAWSTGAYESWPPEVRRQCDLIAAATLARIGWGAEPR